MTRSHDRGSSIFRHGALGQLFAANGSSVPVSITNSSEDVLVLILDGSAEFTRNPLTNLTLESSSGRGVLRTPGFAEHIGPNLLRFVVDQSRHVVQRREFVRVIATQPVRLESEDGSLLFETVTHDISGGGMLIKVPRHVTLPQGDIYFVLSLAPEPTEDQTVSGMARVVRTRDDDKAAIDFRAISHSNQERLIRFVFECQRLALANTRGDTI
jgi:hypothetical protein